MEASFGLGAAFGARVLAGSLVMCEQEQTRGAEIILEAYFFCGNFFSCCFGFWLLAFGFLLLFFLRFGFLALGFWLFLAFLGFSAFGFSSFCFLVFNFELLAYTCIL